MAVVIVDDSAYEAVGKARHRAEAATMDVNKVFFGVLNNDLLFSPIIINGF